jgi:hypothetical protein
MKMRAPLATAVAIAFGLLVLIGYLIPSSFPGAATITLIRSILVGWAVILAGVAALVGILNLVLSHLSRITAKKNPDYYSILVVVFFLLTLGLGVYEFLAQPASPQFQQVVLAVQVPVEAAMMGLLVITLTFASVRLFQRRKGLMAGVFILSALVFLLIGSGLFAPLQQIGALSWFFSLIQSLPVAGGRGILIGIALGSLTAGLRVLLGADRPYSG